MSHIVTIQTKLYDQVAIAAACQKLQLPAPTQGTAHLYEGEVTGLIVQLPNWQYPAVINTTTGTIQYDNFNGAWGDIDHLNRFLQAYASEKIKLEARKQGHTVTEQALQDGSIRLQITEGV